MNSVRIISIVVAAFVLGAVTTSFVPGCRGSQPAEQDDRPEKAAASDSTPRAPEGSLDADLPEKAVASVGQQPETVVGENGKAPIVPGDWSQWAGTSYRNNTPIATNIPVEWEIGDPPRDPRH